MGLLRFGVRFPTDSPSGHAIGARLAVLRQASAVGAVVYVPELQAMLETLDATDYNAKVAAEADLN